MVTLPMVSVPFVFTFFVSLQSNIISATESSNQDLGYLKFVFNATEFPPEEEYDYIIVGGGTAGCPLAATLSTGSTVLLLERGGLGLLDPDVMREDRIFAAIAQANDKDSPAQVFISEEGVRNARGRILGGSSMINAGLYSRADMDFYLRSGIAWDMSVVDESYQWIEETIVFRPNVSTWQSSVKEALLESGIVPDNGFSLDHKEGTKIGGTIFDETGRRYGAVELLNKAEPKNLRVAIHATVERVLFSSYSSGLSAIGVIYSDSTGKFHQARVCAKGEVILSAGAIGSPQLLLLSGVGPQEYLSSLNITVVHHQPFVGKFVYDVPSNRIEFVSPFQVEKSGLQVVGISTRYGSYIEPFARDNPTSSSLVNSSLLSIGEKISRTFSTGSLQLASPTNVTISPSVRFNYFSNPIDLANCVNAMRLIGTMLRTQALEKYKFQDQFGKKNFKFVGRSLPEDLSDYASIKTFCRETVVTIWHYHGGCSVGKVVDNRFKVVGINALRIVDGSTFSTSPGTNPQATLLMLGRYVGLKIQGERMS